MVVVLAVEQVIMVEMVQTHRSIILLQSVEEEVEQERIQTAGWVVLVEEVMATILVMVGQEQVGREVLVEMVKPALEVVEVEQDNH